MIRNRWHGSSLENNKLSLTLDEVQWLTENRNIRVAADPAQRPLEFIGEYNEISGVSRPFLNIISEKLNVNFEWVENQNWAEGLEKIRMKKAEMVSSIVSTPERLDFLSFTNG